MGAGAGTVVGSAGVTIGCGRLVTGWGADEARSLPSSSLTGVEC